MKNDLRDSSHFCVLACDAFKCKRLSLLTSAGESVYYIGAQHLSVSGFKLLTCYKDFEGIVLLL